MSAFVRLHAGGIVRSGAATLLVGPSGAGKSTLVMRLVIDNFSLLSDDEVWIDPESRLVHPTARPLLLKESAWDLFPRYRPYFMPSGNLGCRSWWLSDDDVRPDCRAVPSPVSSVIALTSRSGGAPRLQRIGQTEALNCMLKESMNFPEVRESGLSTFVDLVKTARLFRLENGDLDECAIMLSRVLP